MDMQLISYKNGMCIKSKYYFRSCGQFGTSDLEVRRIRPTISWTVWQSVGIVFLRIIMVWLFNNTGKGVFAVVLFHTMINIIERIKYHLELQKKEK